MKYLLTGASGFLGKYILSALPKDGVITLGRTKDYDLCADISKPLKSIPAIDVVIHCAGKAHIIPKTSDRDRFK